MTDTMQNKIAAVWILAFVALAFAAGFWTAFGINAAFVALILFFSKE